MQDLKNQKSTIIKKGPFKTKVLENKQISSDIYQLELENREISENSAPGQFVSVLCTGLTLRRPFSVAGTAKSSFQIIYKVVGKGTESMTQLQKGDICDVFGPMGNGFSIENNNPLLIGCGVGIAPILFLAETLEKKGFTHNTVISSKTGIDLGKKFSYTITEDGSSGLKGRLNTHLEKIIAETHPQKIYICGPDPAMKYVSELAKKSKIPCEVSLEGDFACGTGVCMGCVRLMNVDGQVVNRRVCKDGPVFKGEEVIW